MLSPRFSFSYRETNFCSWAAFSTPSCAAATPKHWTALIITHPGVLAQREALVAPAAADVIDVTGDIVVAPQATPWTTILHLDSLGGFHAQAEQLVRDLLAAEWAARHGCGVDVGLRRFAVANVPYLRPTVPRQPNSVDCALFTAEFARRFAQQAPPVFEHVGYLHFLRPDWFPAAAAGPILRRHTIQSILALAGQAPPPPPLSVTEAPPLQPSGAPSERAAAPPRAPSDPSQVVPRAAPLGRALNASAGDPAQQRLREAAAVAAARTLAAGARMKHIHEPRRLYNQRATDTQAKYTLLHTCAESVRCDAAAAHRAAVLFATST